MPAKASFVRLILAIGLSSVLVGEAVGDEQGEDSSQLGNYNLRLRANGYIIQELDERLKRVKWKLRSVNFNTRHVYEIIENSVSYLEGNVCKDSEFQCDRGGQFKRQCVSELLACDGVKDCLNGRDEDQTLCRVSELRPGVSYSGFIGKTVGCMSNTRYAYSCRITVASVIRSKVHPGLMSLKMHSQCTIHLRGVFDGNHTQEITSRPVGSYSVGNRRWSTSVGPYSSDCYFTDNFRAMWCNSRQGVTSCTHRLFYYRND